MANELRELEVRLAAKAEQRDREISDIREAIAAASAEIEGLQEAVREAREAGRTSPLALWAPTLATAVALAGLATFALDQTTIPINERADAQQEKTDKMQARLDEVDGNQREVQTELRWLKERIGIVDMEQTKTREELLKGDDR